MQCGSQRASCGPTTFRTAFTLECSSQIPVPPAASTIQREGSPMIGEPNLLIIGLGIWTFAAGTLISVYIFFVRRDARIMRLTMLVAIYGFVYLLVAVFSEPILASALSTSDVTAIQHIGFWIGFIAVLFYIHNQRL